MTPRPRLVVAAVVVAAYVAAAAATVALSARHVRPLFEGVGPPAAYQWVKPPPQFATVNVTPHAQTINLTLTAAGTPEAGPSSSDAQLILNLPKGAITAHGNDTGVQVKITPRDPAALPAVPAGEHAAGNAYQVEMSYQPSGTAVTQLALAGNIIMVTPFDAAAILYAPDPSAPWQPLATQPLSGNTTIGSTISGPGVFLAAAKGATTTSSVPSGGGGGSGGTIVLAVVIVVLVALLAVAAVVLRRRRARSQSGPAGASGVGRPRAGSARARSGAPGRGPPQARARGKGSRRGR